MASAATPPPASTDGALDMVLTGMRYLTAADPAVMVTGEQTRATCRLVRPGLPLRHLRSVRAGCLDGGDAVLHACSLSALGATIEAARDPATGTPGLSAR